MKKEFDVKENIAYPFFMPLSSHIKRRSGLTGPLTKLTAMRIKDRTRLMM